MKSWITGLLLHWAAAGCVMAEGEWPQFLGRNADGHAGSTKLPLSWSASENVTWSVDIPGTGWSSPVVSGRSIWMATATEEGKSLRAVCVDRKNGKLLHDVEVLRVEAPEAIHKLNSHASPTPVIEGGRVYFFFGMYGAVCVDNATGKVVWKNTELPHDHGKNGPGSSPLLHGDLLILNCDGTEKRYVTALDKKSGKRVWTFERSNGPKLEGRNPELKKAYHTPTVIRVGDHEELITMGAYRINALDPKTGKELWWVEIPGFSNVPCLAYAHGMVYLATGFMKPELWAIKPGGKGDVTETHVVWKVTRQVPQKPSPVVVGDEIYMISDNGILTCMDAKTGAIHYSERVGGEFSASPLVAGNRIYLFDQEGKVSVVEAGQSYKVISKSALGDGFMASPAVAGDELYLRSKTKLYRVEKGGSPGLSSN